jgi:hypothetical protein
MFDVLLGRLYSSPTFYAEALSGGIPGSWEKRLEVLSLRKTG